MKSFAPKKKEIFSSCWFGVLIPLFIVLVTFLALSPVLKNGFTNWDDDVQFLDNPIIRGLDFNHLKAIWTSTVLNIYVPLTQMTFAVEHYFFGYNSFVSHLINLIFHLIATLLVFRLGAKMKLGLGGAAFASLIFGIHPMHVESVAWLVERKDVLYAVFYLSALMNYIHYLEGKGKKYFLWTVLLGLASMLAKPMALSLPLVLFLFDWFYGRKWTARILFEKIPHFIYVIPLAWITYSLHARNPIGNILEAILIWLWTFKFYLVKFIWPIVLVPLYSLPKPVSLGNSEYVFAVVFFAVMIWAIVRFRKNRWFIFAFLFYFLSIFFLLRFDDKGDAAVVADRFMYLPSLGFCFFLGMMIESFFGGLNYSKKLRWILIGVLIVIFSTLFLKTYQQTKIWRNSLDLWTYILRYYPDRPTAYNNRGHYYLNQGEYDKALADFNKAIELDAKNAGAYDNRGVLYLRQGDYEKALSDVNKAIELDPQKSGSYDNRGLILSQKGESNQALVEYNKALKTRNTNYKVFNNRGLLYQELGKFDLAIEDYSRALQINPNFLEAYINRGNVYCWTKQFALALADYRRALQLSPQNHFAVYGIGMAYFFQGDYDKAIEQYNLALKIEPQYDKAYYYRSCAYKEKGEYGHALEDALKAKSLGYIEEGYIEELQKYIPK